MNKIKKIILIIIFTILIILIFKNNKIINNSVIDAFSLWLNKVFPSLFIMFILNDIIINTNILNSITNILNPIFNKIYHTGNNSSLAFLLSFFSGTPSSAFILKEMVNNNQIDEVSANKLIGFTFFSNPLFLYNILSLTFNKYITIRIILIHYFTNFIIGLFFKKNNPIKLNSNYNYSNKKLFDIISISIKKSMDILIMILGTITFYMIISNLIINIFNINNIPLVIIKGLLEITQSLNILSSIKSISIIKEIIALSIISFGGLSIHSQIFALLKDTNINYKNFLYGRILHFLLATFTYIIFVISFSSTS